MQKYPDLERILSAWLGIGDSESEDTWGELFRDLKDRGLRGLQLVVSDAHSGIRAALARHFQGVAWQRCRVHFKRELGRKVSISSMVLLMAVMVRLKGWGVVISTPAFFNRLRDQIGQISHLIFIFPFITIRLI